MAGKDVDQTSDVTPVFWAVETDSTKLKDKNPNLSTSTIRPSSTKRVVAANTWKSKEEIPVALDFRYPEPAHPNL